MTLQAFSMNANHGFENTYHQAWTQFGNENQTQQTMLHRAPTGPIYDQNMMMQHQTWNSALYQSMQSPSQGKVRARNLDEDSFASSKRARTMSTVNNLQPAYQGISNSGMEGVQSSFSGTQVTPVVAAPSMDVEDDNAKMHLIPPAWQKSFRSYNLYGH